MASMLKRHPSIIFSTITLMIVLAQGIWVMSARAADNQYIKRDMANIQMEISRIKVERSSDHDLLIIVDTNVKNNTKLLEKIEKNTTK